MKAKTLNRSFASWMIAAAILALITGCAVAPAPGPPLGAQTGQLIITRSFELGGLAIALLVDGKRVGTLTYNRGYAAPIAPGPHTLSVAQIPDRVRNRSNPIRIVVRGGETYRFTATRLGPRVVLR